MTLSRADCSTAEAEGEQVRRLKVAHRDPSHAAAVEETKHGGGVTLALGFAVAQDLSSGALVRVPGRGMAGQGSWHISLLGGQQATPAAEEMARFVTTPSSPTSARSRCFRIRSRHPAAAIVSLLSSTSVLPRARATPRLDAAANPRLRSFNAGRTRPSTLASSFRYSADQ